MSYQWLTEIDKYLTIVGADWEAYIEDWKSFAGYGPAERDYQPIAVINHHTAGPADYPKNKLTTKCNIYIDPRGKVWIMSAGYQFDSGDGDRRVAEAIMRGEVPPKAADTASNGQRILGNKFFIDIEVGHPGNGSPIPEVQRDALIKTNAALMLMMGWDPKVNLIDHKWWTTRKIDVRWEWQGAPDTMEQIQMDTEEYMQTMDDPGVPNLDECEPWQREAWIKAWQFDNDLINEDTHPGALLTKGDFFTLMERHGFYDGEASG